jgi:hypothetical protein
MKNPAKELLPAIYQELTGAIFIGSEAVDVYDRVPNLPWDNSKTYQYWVHIAEPQTTPIQFAKDRFLSRTIVNIEVATLFELQAESGGNEIADEIVNRITTLLITRGGVPYEIEGFAGISVTLEDITTVKGNIDTAYYVGKTIRVGYTLEELI